MRGAAWGIGFAAAVFGAIVAGYAVWVARVWADGGYAGKLVTWTALTLHRTLQIVKRPGNLHTFQVLPAAGSWSGRSDGS